jgi:hypothetical protein
LRIERSPGPSPDPSYSLWGSEEEEEEEEEKKKKKEDEVGG